MGGEQSLFGCALLPNRLCDHLIVAPCHEPLSPSSSSRRCAAPKRSQLFGGSLKSTALDQTSLRASAAVWRRAMVVSMSPLAAPHPKAVSATARQPVRLPRVFADQSGNVTLTTSSSLNLDTGEIANSGGDLFWNGTELTSQGRAGLYNLGKFGPRIFKSIASRSAAREGSRPSLSARDVDAHHWTHPQASQNGFLILLTQLTRPELVASTNLCSEVRLGSEPTRSKKKGTKNEKEKEQNQFPSGNAAPDKRVPAMKRYRQFSGMD